MTPGALAASGAFYGYFIRFSLAAMGQILAKCKKNSYEI
jgi:hypothetical protein